MADVRLLKPLDYLSTFLEHGVREDGRALDCPRGVQLNTGTISTANGSSLVAMDDTTVVCGVKAELHAGTLEPAGQCGVVCNVTLGPLSSAAIASGPPSPLAQSLSQRLQLIVTKCIDKSDLCIDDANKLSWVLYVDVVCLNHAGSLEDACVLAAAAALKTTSLPRVTPTTGLPVVHTQSCEPLRVSVLPAAVTFALCNDFVLREPTLCEEQLSTGRVCVTALSNGQLFGVHKTGDPELPAAKLTEMCSEAMKVVSKCEQLILEL